MASSLLFTAIVATILFSSTMGHSQMRCAKYNSATGQCSAPIRNQVVSFEQEAYDMTSGGAICQSRMSNPISASYSNGAGCPSYAGCPDAMGTYTPGETFTIMWFARNHAVENQTPGNIVLYLSPAESQTQGADVAQSQFTQICTAPFSSCNGQNGDTVKCTTQCTMPSGTANGIYTLWWKWAWPNHNSVYSTCADIYVTSGSSTPSQSSSTSARSSTSSSSTSSSTTTSTSSSSSTGSKVPSSSTSTSTTAKASSSTSGRLSSSSSTSTKASTSSSSSTCTSGTMKCLTTSTYSTCDRGSWGPAQSCGPQSMCSASGDSIYCVPNSSASSTSSSSNGSSGSCTLGYQQCVGTNRYQTCGNGRNGPEWAAPQSCQAGLSCHASATANNVYCY